jgi:hypothetical protein
LAVHTHVLFGRVDAHTERRYDLAIYLHAALLDKLLALAAAGDTGLGQHLL